MINKLKLLAVAAATCALLPLGAQATAFNGGSTASFSFSETVLNMQPASITIEATGNTSLTPDPDRPGTGAMSSVEMVGTALDVTGTNLNTWAAAGSGFNIIGHKNGAVTGIIELTNFAFSNATKSLTFSMSVNGGAASNGALVVFTSSNVNTTGSSKTITPFVGGNDPTGVHSATKLRLTTASATAVAAALGYNDFLTISTLASTTFGDLTITAAAPVPEPSTYALMALGLAVAGTVARRRASK